LPPQMVWSGHRRTRSQHRRETCFLRHAKETCWAPRATTRFNDHIRRDRN
jgi:hypothetical protein